MVAAVTLLAAVALLGRAGLGAGQPVPEIDSAHAGVPADETLPHRAGWRRVTVTPSRGPAFAALLYYPALAGGEGATYDGSAAPYPAVAFGHGFLQTPDRYAGTLQHLAAAGFFVIATESATGASPDHAQFALDLRESLTYLQQAGEQPDSWLYQQVRSSRFGVFGHSMGGGASVLAAAGDERIGALAHLAAADTRPSAVAAMRDVRVPFHTIVGSQDTIVPPASTRRIHDAGGPPRILSTIAGGSHCGFQTTPFPIGCDRGSLPATDQIALTARLLQAFFQVYLDTEDAWRAVWGPEAEAGPPLGREADPGLALTPADQRGEAAPGADATYELLLRNAGRQAAAFGLEPEPSEWPVTIEPEVTEVLAPGAAAVVRVAVRVPPGAQAGAAGSVLVSAFRLGDRGTRAYAVLSTSVTADAPVRTPTPTESPTPDATPTPTDTARPAPTREPTLTAAPAAPRPLFLPRAGR